MDIGVNATVFYEVVSGKYQELMSFQSSCKYIYKMNCDCEQVYSMY